MESVEIEFTALPAHVRTARLVASAVARQCGVDEAVLDEVRLAVGEACSRAVELHAREAPDRPVMVIFADAPGRFTVAIRDRLIMLAIRPGLPISHSPPALVVGPGVEGVIPSPLTAEEFDTVTVSGE